MLEEEIENIILKEQNVIPFLKELTPKDKRAIAPSLKKLYNKITEIKYVESKSSRGIVSYNSVRTYSDKQRNEIEKACFICLNKTDIKRTLFNASNLAVDDYYLENIIPWYKPKWYSDLINEDIPWGLSYDIMMKLNKDGLLELSHQIIINKLPNAIVEHKWTSEKRVSLYKPEVLLKHKETLEEHIWFLFEEESTLNNYYNYLHLENYKNGNDAWIDTFVNLINEKKLNRKKLLIATIYTSTKGFNKSLSGWFFDLLIKLNPTIDEVLILQNEFFTALNSPHSKVINTVLKFFKSVADHKKFKYKIFVENSSVLLNSETKSVVNSTLMILDKIVKTHMNSKISVCNKAAEALINLDEKIQLRAAKIIDKYGDSKKQELLEEVSLYSDNLFHSSKEILREYLVSSEKNEEEFFEVEDSDILSEENKLPTYDTLDDLIFFVSQVIDNNEVYHIDLLLNYLPKLNVLLNNDNVAKLEPIFKRSIDLSMSFDSWNSQIGNLESGAACYINDFAEILMKKHPSELENFRRVKDLKIKKLREDRFNKTRADHYLKKIEDQHIPDYIYQIHRSLFIKSKSFIKKELKLDLLSTPTHSPCWIDPYTLIGRIISYEKSNEEIDLFDFQIAIGRVPLNIELLDIIKHIDKIGNNDIKKVLKYHFDLLDIQNDDILRPELWLQSILIKNKDTDVEYFQKYITTSLQREKGNYDWDCKLRNHFYKEHDYKLGKEVQRKMVRKELRYKDFNLQKTKQETLISSIKNIFNRKPSKVSSIYEYIHFKKEKYYTTIQPHDDVKFLYLSPNNPSMFLSHVIHINLKESTFFDEGGKKNMINLLKGLYEIWHRPDYSESTYLFLAIGLLCSDKVARELAAEIWIKTNSEEKINNPKLGAIIGKLELSEYAPLKRFTDLLTASLFNVSKAHNKLLYILLDNVIGNMNDVPIRGLKKLLEIFLELKHNFPEVEVNEFTKEKLLIWKETNTLKAIITKLI